MKTLPQPDAYGFVVFCDDIRTEYTGKQIYIGAYNGGRMYINVPFPVVLPQFCISVTYFERLDIKGETVKFLVFFPGDEPDKPSFVAESSTEETLRLPWTEYPKFGDEDSVEVIRLETRYVFSGLTLKGPGILRVRAENKLGRIRLGSLVVEPAPKPQ